MQTLFVTTKCANHVRPLNGNDEAWRSIGIASLKTRCQVKKGTDDEFGWNALIYSIFYAIIECCV